MIQQVVCRQAIPCRPADAHPVANIGSVSRVLGYKDLPGHCTDMIIVQYRRVNRIRMFDSPIGCQDALVVCCYVKMGL